MARITRKQGNSLWLNIPGSSFDLIDSVWANWSGVYKIKDSEGLVVLSGDLTKDATMLAQFYLHLGHTEMNTLAVGSYTLTIEVSNATVDYVQELRGVDLVITGQDV